MERTALRGRLRWQTAAVTSVTKQTASVVTIELDPPDWPGHQAGQHLDVRLTAEDGYTAEREYSIASAPGEPVAITVERLEDGEVSPYLTGELRAGDQLELRGPVGGYFCGSPATAARCCCWPAGRASYRCGPSCGTASAPAATSRRACCTPPAPCRT
jgi:ferredoxin-NADP reductase